VKKEAPLLNSQGEDLPPITRREQRYFTLLTRLDATTRQLSSSSKINKYFTRRQGRIQDFGKGGEGGKDNLLPPRDAHNSRSARNGATSFLT